MTQLSDQPRTTRPEDRRRQVIVTVSMLFCIFGTLVGVGVLGTRVEESSGGALAADATLLAPATPAFSIWSVIYLGLLAYTVWQWLPEQARDRRHRGIGGLAAASMILNASWLLVTQQGWIWISVAVMALLVFVLGTLVAALTATPSYGVIETLVVDGTFGMYLGWVSVAACANVTAALVSSGVNPTGFVGPFAAVLVIAVATVIGVFLVGRLGARWAVSGAMAWGLLWIAWGRWTSEPESGVVGFAALAGAAAILAATAKAQAAAAPSGSER